MSVDQGVLKLNGKHQAITSQPQTWNQQSNKQSIVVRKRKVYNFVIKQLFFKSECYQEQKDYKIYENIQQSICDSQDQLYYSMYLIKKKNIYQDNRSKNQLTSDEDLTKNPYLDYDVSIEFSPYCFPDKQFYHKLSDFKQYKERQLKKGQKDKYSRALKFLEDLMDDDYQELRQQVFQLYQICNQELFQNHFDILLLQQNFHHQHQLLLHCSSILQSMFCKDYEENIILEFPKFAYINLTGYESQDNLEFCQEINYYYQNFYLYFSIYNGVEIKQPFKEHKRYTTIPYYNKKDISEFELKFIFNNHIKNKLMQFKPTIIYVHVQNTKKFSINLAALSKFVRKLKRISSVIIYIQYDVEQILEKSTLKFMRTVNACLFGLSGIQCITQKTLFKLDEDILTLQAIINSLQQIQLKNYMQIQKFFLEKLQQKLTDLRKKHKIILMGEKKNFIIQYQDEEKNAIQYQRFVVSYQHKIIILLDFNNQQFYYSKFTDFPDQSVQLNKPDQTNSFIKTTLQYFENTKIQGKMSNAVVIINQSQILFAYPIFKNQNKVKITGNLQKNQEDMKINQNQQKNYRQNMMDVIWYYSLDNNEWGEIEREQDNSVLCKDKYFEQSDKKFDKKQNIIGQTVCYQPHPQERIEDYDIYSIFGGESMKSFQPVNLIEYLFINVKKGKFYSKFIRRSLNPFKGSLKPSPYQLVLPITNIEILSTQIKCAYLILRPWNQTKKNYYEAMLNPENLKKTQMVILLKSFTTIFLDIDYKISKDSEYQLNILEMMNQDVNWMEIQKINENQWEWKAVFTNFLKFRNWRLIKKKSVTGSEGEQDKKEGKNISQNNKVKAIQHNIANGTFVSLEFTISLNYQKNQNASQELAIEGLPFSPKDWLVETKIPWIYEQGD